jgi:5'-3' exonuclease
MLALVVRTSRGFTPSSRRACIGSSTRYLSDRRLSEWDEIFADSPKDSSSSSSKKPMASSGISGYTTHDEDTSEAYDPSENPFPDMDAPLEVTSPSTLGDTDSPAENPFPDFDMPLTLTPSFAASKPSASVPSRGGSPPSSSSAIASRSESTDAEFGAYDYDPSQYDFPEMDDSFLLADSAPPQSAAWDEPSPSRQQQQPSTQRKPPPANKVRAVMIQPQTAAAVPPSPVVAEAPTPAPAVAQMSPAEPMQRTEVQVPLDRDDLHIKGSNGGPVDSILEKLELRLEALEQTIYTENKGEEFNINSPKQVSSILFGTPSESTNKATLEAMGAAGHIMADLVLRYRQQKQDIKRMVRKAENTEDGTQINDFSKSQVAAKPKEDTTTEDGASNDPLLLVDASAYIFRAYYSMPAIHRSDGMPVGAVMGFCNMLNRLILTRVLNGDCPRLVLVFDPKGKNFRHELYDEYKANRPECPIDLVPQFDLIREVAKAYGIPEVEAIGFEADDVIATLATMALEEGIDTHILSGDKDLMQLITPMDKSPYVHMIDPMSMSRVDHDVVFEKWGVGPELVGDILALAGDASDNVPGVPGIGPKIAAILLEEFGSLTGLLEGLDQVKQKGRREKLIDNKDMALLSRQLVELDRAIPADQMTTVPIAMTKVTSLRMEPMNGDRLLAFYDEMGFRDLKRRVENRLTQTDRKKPARKKSTSSSWKRPKAEVPKAEDYADVPF